ncbi:MAG: hypothetical protein RL272_294 [Candidatus Parcubacteria bacterium]
MFVWTKEYSVGVQEMDEQHQQFLAIANEALNLAIEKQTSNDALLKVLVRFLNYAHYHLSTEEEYIARFGCPQPGHIEAHDEFRATFNKLFSKAWESDVATSHQYAEDAARYAGQWLLNHILIVDKGYTECFNEHGLR